MPAAGSAWCAWSELENVHSKRWMRLARGEGRGEESRKEQQMNRVCLVGVGGVPAVYGTDAKPGSPDRLPALSDEQVAAVALQDFAFVISI